MEGRLVRLSGQDTRRGTFVQRHSVLIDHKTGGEYLPLQNLSADSEARELSENTSVESLSQTLKDRLPKT